MATPMIGHQGTSSSSMPGSTAGTSLRQTCAFCNKRKIKCDGKRPCSRCVDNGADCRSDRVKRSRSVNKGPDTTSNSALALKLRQYERLLLAHGINLDASEPAGHDDEVMADADIPGYDETLSQEGCQQPRDADHSLWNVLKDRMPPPDSPREPDLALSLSSDDSATAELLIWGRPNFVSLQPLHPTSSQIMLLWQAFVNNFDPLVKLFHTPTVQDSIFQTATNLDSIKPGTEALMFAVYLSATVTMSELQCLETLESPKPVLLKRFANATQQALVNAKFLKSTDIVILQALTLYLLSVRSFIDKQALWLLAGLAVRLGESIGLHQEANLRSLSLFDAEMRRRLWSQILLVNGCPARQPRSDDSSTRAPSSCNDSDLYPSMVNPPAGREGGTEMLFCVLRREIGDCMGRLKAETPGCSGLASEMQELSGLETRIGELTRRCDASVPLHLFTILVGRSAVAQLRFAAQTAACFGSNDSVRSVAPEVRTALLREAIAVLAHDAEIHSSQALEPFLWHPAVQFSFDALVYVLGELRREVSGEMCEAAWVEVNRVYEDHPEFVTEQGNPVFVAMGDLAARAWAKRVDFVRRVKLGQHGLSEAIEYPAESHALARLREQRQSTGPKGTQRSRSEEDTKGKRRRTDEDDDDDDGDGGDASWWQKWQRTLRDAGYLQGGHLGRTF